MLRLTVIFCLLLAVPASAQTAEVPIGPDLDARIGQATLDAIEARVPGSAIRMKVDVVRSGFSADPDAGVGADGQAGVSVELPSTPLLPKGRIQIPVLVDGRREAFALVNIAHYDSVATIPESLSAGDPVDPADLQFAWMDVTRFPGAPLTPSTVRNWATTDLTASRGLSANRPLRSSDIAPRPAAEAGDPIRMIYKRRGFALEITCKARDRGQVGDVIRLYADDSDTMYRGRLLGEGRAEWLETL